MRSISASENNHFSTNSPVLMSSFKNEVISTGDEFKALKGRYAIC
jgi:hypothetical protein